MACVRLQLLGLMAILVMAAGVVPVMAQEVVIDAGYLDYFALTDGRNIDVGALGGGIEGDPNTHKIFVAKQASAPSPPLPLDGRLTGTVHGKFRVVGLTDRNGSGFIESGDLDNAFDVSWQLVLVDKGSNTASFVQSVGVGPEGTANPFFPPASVNFPPIAGGTASAWNISTCDVTGFNPNTGSTFCNPFAILAPPGPPVESYTGFVDYTFPVSIPYLNDFNPGLTVNAPGENWIITALVGNTSLAGGPVAYGHTPAFDPNLAIIEADTDLVGPNTTLDFPGEEANIPKANLLTTVQINVTPEPGTLALLGMGILGLLRRRNG